MANSTIDGLTAKASPVAADEVPIWDVAGAATKKCSFTNILSGIGIPTLGAANSFTLGPNTFAAGADGNIAAIVKANSGTQSADIFETQDSGANPLFAVDQKGFPYSKASEQTHSSNFTNATASLANLNFSFNLITGARYAIEVFLNAFNSTGSEGIQIDFGGGGVSFNAFFAILQFVGTGVAGTVITGSATTPLTATTIGAASDTTGILVTGYCTINSGGTLIPRAAEVSHATGTLTIRGGSRMRVNRINNAV